MNVLSQYVSVNFGLIMGSTIVIGTIATLVTCAILEFMKYKKYKNGL